MAFSSRSHKSSSKRQDRGDDDLIGSSQVKRKGLERSSNRSKFLTIDATEVAKAMETHMQTPLPDCTIMFPWLHSYSTSLPPHYPTAITIVRSQPMPQQWIQNSGVLKSSIDPHEFLMTWTSEKNYRHSDRKESALILRRLIHQELSNINETLSNDDIEDCVDLCHQYNVLPFLTTDAYARQTYDIGKNKRVCNSFHQGSSTEYITSYSKQPGAFRRFDIQPAKMVEMSSTIVIYSLSGKDGSSTDTQKHGCQQLATLVKLALKFIQRNYLSMEKREHDIRILEYSALEEIATGLMGTPPMLTTTLKKNVPQQLVSHFDVESFNNWDRDLLYREKLEMSMMSSATSVDELSSVWFGNSTDYQIYKLMRSGNEPTENFSKHSTYYSVENSIVGIRNLNYDPNNSLSIDAKFFNIPKTKKPWALMIRCSEDALPPTVEKLWEYLTLLLHAKVYQRVEFDFPSSGTITLGSLNIEFIKVVLNTCFVMYQLSKESCLGTLVHCSDGYTETTFLLVAYLIFLWDLSLEETMINLHLKKERPFFLFPVDLQVLGHLQTLLRSFSPKRPENSHFFAKSSEGKFQPLDITPEMFSKVFLFKVPSDSTFTSLKGPLPSRILSHLYLGSLEHAQSPTLLKKLGINYIVSVGEVLSWTANCHERRTVSSSSFSTCTISDYKVTESRTYPLPISGQYEDDNSSIEILTQDGFKILRIMNLGDNGKDKLSHQLEKILGFIDECYQNNGKVLVHCMVGVSRSATVCIAECMKRLHCDLLRAYLFVRVRRLNIIIQPNLMFMYELLKWQEFNGEKRNIDWHILCRSVSELNNNYI